jgi:hypothetical protein
MLLYNEFVFNIGLSIYNPAAQTSCLKNRWSVIQSTTSRLLSKSTLNSILIVIIYPQNLYKQCWFVCWSSFSAVKDSIPYVTIYLYVCIVINVATVWCSFAVKSSWALWYNIVTVSMVILLKEGLELLSVAMWKQFTEVKDCSIIHGLLCGCIYCYITQQSRLLTS